MRMWIPESPRWLVIHGREKEAEEVVAGIEKRFEDAGARSQAASPATPPFGFRSRDAHPAGRSVRHAASTAIACSAFVGLTLMAAQAFFYNAIFFTYALVLTKFYAVSSGAVGWYILPFALGNFLGPVVARPPVRHLWAPAS